MEKRKTISDLLAVSTSRDAEPRVSESDAPKRTSEIRPHADHERMRKEITFYGNTYMEAVAQAMRQPGGMRAVNLRNLSIGLADGTTQEEPGIQLPLLLRGRGDVFFVSAGEDACELASANVPRGKAADETLDASSLDMKSLDIDDLYQLEGVLVNETMRLNPSMKGTKGTRPKRATLIKRDDGYCARTEDGKLYKVPSAYIRNKLGEGSKVAALIPKDNPDYPWVAVQPEGNYDSALLDDYEKAMKIEGEE